jgi:hypothetical protein
VSAGGFLRTYIVRLKLTTFEMAGYLEREYTTSTKYWPAFSTELVAKERLVTPSTEVLVLINGIAWPPDVTTIFMAEQVGVELPEG